MVKQITVDEKGVVVCASIGGYIPDGIDVGEIPAEVMSCPGKWTYKDGRFEPNTGFVPSEEDEGITIDDLAAAVAELAEIVGGM